jgi:DtxR family manganese transport transcriptional regulator
MRKKKTQRSQPATGSQERTARQALAFRASREHNAAETAEDYAELIDDLIRERGEARSVEMAERLGVSHVTVAKTVQRLAKRGLVHCRPYRSIFLTDEGRTLAERCRARHKDVVDFLTALGVSARTAETDAEGIEHHVSGETLEAMRKFVRQRRPM